MMVDPAVGTRPGQKSAYERGTQADVWLKGPDGKPHIGSMFYLFISFTSKLTPLELSGRGQ